MMGSLCHGSPFVVYVWSTFNTLSRIVVLLSWKIYFWYGCGAHIYRCLVPCIVDVIHAECENTSQFSV